MKTLILRATEAEILEKVGGITAYAGVKEPTAGDDGRLFDRLSIADEDSALLRRFMLAAFSEALERLKDFAVGSSSVAMVLELRLEVSESYDESLTPAVGESFRLYLAAAVLWHWLRLAWPDRAGEWAEEAQKHLLNIERNLYHRRRPQKRNYEN